MKKISKLTEHGFGIAPLPTSLFIEIGRFTAAWEDFCEQELSEKIPFAFSSLGGYEYKDEQKTDFKEDFHISLAYQPAKENLSKADKNFIRLGKEIITACKSVIYDSIQLISEETGVDFSKLLSHDDAFSLRCLHYLPSDRKVIAAPHPDKGLLTIQLYESSPGLQYFWDNKWITFKPKGMNAIYFPGLLSQYHSQCKIKGLSHRVISNKESEQSGRYSFVLFLDSSNPMCYNKEKFGPTQKFFTPGSNYGMAFEEFKNYFTEKENSESHL